MYVRSLSSFKMLAPHSTNNFVNELNFSATAFSLYTHIGTSHIGSDFKLVYVVSFKRPSRRCFLAFLLACSFGTEGVGCDLLEGHDVQQLQCQLPLPPDDRGGQRKGDEHSFTGLEAWLDEGFNPTSLLQLLR